MTTYYIFSTFTMEDQKLLDLESEVIPKHEHKTVPSVTDDEILCEDVQNNCMNDIDDLILQPEKVIKSDKQSSFENTYEVIDQESKAFHGGKDYTEVAVKSVNKENENILESDVLTCTEIDDFANPLKIEYPQEDLVIASEKLESKVPDHDKTEKNQDNEVPNVAQPNVKIEDIPEVISTMLTKKNSDDDVCDIKIGPEELFCRIGLGKIE